MLVADLEGSLAGQLNPVIKVDKQGSNLKSGRITGSHPREVKAHGLSSGGMHSHRLRGIKSVASLELWRRVAR